MTENEAIEKLKNMRLFMQIEDKSNDCKFTDCLLYTSPSPRD